MSRRKQEEKIVAQLRELASLPGNKHCFDCAQRGPTYVNMTIGSFTCTSCSGILRGLNPPHRVKSISMATFTADEYEFIKSRGNDYCRRIWLGLYDNDSRPVESGYKDETHMKDFMMTKYEKKRWYVTPSEVARQQMLLDRAQADRRSTNASETLSLGSTGSPSSVQRAAAGGGANGQGRSVPSLVDMSATPPGSARHVTQQQGAPPVGSLVDPFSSPVHAPGPPPPTVMTQLPRGATVDSNNGFADFDSAFSGSSGFSSAGFPDALPKSQTVPANLIAPPTGNAFPQPVSTVSPLQPRQPPTASSWANGSAGGVQVAPNLMPLQPSHHQQQQQPAHPPPATAAQQQQQQHQQQMSAADKYSALAELDGLFSSSKSSLGGGGPGQSEYNSNPAPAPGGMGTIYGATPLSQPMQTHSSGSVFGSMSQAVSPPSTSSYGGSVFGNSGHHQQQQPVMSKSQSAFGGFSTAPPGGQAYHQQGQQQQQQANNFGVPGTTSNPFMSSSSTPLSPQQQQQQQGGGGAGQWGAGQHHQMHHGAGGPPPHVNNPFLGGGGHPGGGQQQHQSNPWGPPTSMTPGLVGQQSGQSMVFGQHQQHQQQQQHGFMAQSATGAIGGSNWNPFL